MALELEECIVSKFRTTVSQNDIFSVVIKFLMEGGVFKIDETYYAFSNDLLLCELIDPQPSEDGGVTAEALKASSLTFNEFIHGCINATTEDIDNIDFMLCDAVEV